jgi:uncharacterized protein (DUF2062 family)
LIKFFRLKGAPRKIALGFAIGACVNFYPTFGIGIPLAGLFAGLAMSSIPAGLLGDVAFKPLFPVFFYLNLVTGYFFLPGGNQDLDKMWIELMNLSPATFVKLGKIFFAGAIVNSLLLGIVLYSVVYLVMLKYRRRLLRMLLRRRQARGKIML